MRTRFLVALIGGTLLAATPAQSQTSLRILGEPVIPGNVVLTDSTLRERFAMLMRESPTFAMAIDSVGRAGIPLTIRLFGVRPTAGGMVAAHTPGYADYKAGADSAVLAVEVGIDVDYMAFLAAVQNVDADALQQDLAIVLAHEVYGHAVPLILSGSTSGRCRDLTKQPDGMAESCSLPRENRIREEIGATVRTRYSASALAIQPPAIGIMAVPQSYIGRQ